jgi:hypothetical protein
MSRKYVSHRWVQNSSEWIEVMIQLGYDLNVLTKTLLVRQQHSGAQSVYYMMISSVTKKRVDWTILGETFGMKRQKLRFVEEDIIRSEILSTTTIDHRLISK